MGNKVGRSSVGFVTFFGVSAAAVARFVLQVDGMLQLD